MTLPPLALYVHLPWCERKCPYCDFNSHPLRASNLSPLTRQRAYVDALLADLDYELRWLKLETDAPAPLISIFIGGGTPSLFGSEPVARLLEGVRRRLPWADDIEITLEANPGSAEAERFAGYRAAGVNRLSLGVQSFAADSLLALGRIHGPDEAMAAVESAAAAGFERVNLDLMFGLPGQTVAAALADLERAIELAPSHLSWYQLTIEPNTAFDHAPPRLPDEDTSWAIQEAGEARLGRAGYRQYEVSAYARPGEQCRHNRNYWEFGDYLGIGAGAHAKLTLSDGRVVRRWRRRHPEAYQRAAGTADGVAGQRVLSREDLGFEFMLNALRLVQGVQPELLPARTGLDGQALAKGLARARSLGLLAADSLRPTAMGRRFLNDLINLFADT